MIFVCLMSSYSSTHQASVNDRTCLFMAQFLWLIRQIRVSVSQSNYQIEIGERYNHCIISQYEFVHKQRHFMRNECVDIL